LGDGLAVLFKKSLALKPNEATEGTGDGWVLGVREKWHPGDRRELLGRKSSIGRLHWGTKENQTVSQEKAGGDTSIQGELFLSGHVARLFLLTVDSNKNESWGE